MGMIIPPELKSQLRQEWEKIDHAEEYSYVDFFDTEKVVLEG